MNSFKNDSKSNDGVNNYSYRLLNASYVKMRCLYMHDAFWASLEPSELSSFISQVRKWLFQEVVISPRDKARVEPSSDSSIFLLSHNLLT